MLDQAQEFAARLERTIRSALPGDANIRANRNGDKIIIRSDKEGLGNAPALMPLFAKGEPVAYWSLYMFAAASRDGKFLKVEQMRLAFRPKYEGRPIVRLDFEDQYTRYPVSHWQMHAERGAMSFLLALTRGANKKNEPVALEQLHLSNGGRRFRPGVEDFMQFLIEDCGFDAKSGWKQAVQDGREISRRFQIRTIARDFQAEVATVLRDLNWTVDPPEGIELIENIEALRES